MSPPVVYYFPIRGRAEPAKLVLASKGVSWKLETVDRAAIKDLSKFKFGQAPGYSDDEIPMMSQSNAILRHLGRKYDMYGASRKEQALIDETVDAVEDLQLKYLGLVYMDKLSDEGKANYWKTHGDPSTTTESNRGAHLGYLAALVDSGSGKHIAGSSLSIADVAVWNIVDNHLKIFAQEIPKAYPKLQSFHTEFASMSSIKSYLESDQRMSQNNGNGLG